MLSRGRRYPVLMMWWILLCAAAVYGRPDDDEGLGLTEALASASASASSSVGGWPELIKPSPQPVDGVGCVQPGDMYNAVLGRECYVCACFFNELGQLKAKCAPCNNCWNHEAPLPLPPAPSPLPLPDILPLPNPLPLPGPVPVPEHIRIPRPIPLPAPFCPPPTVIPGPPRPYPVPVPVPGKKVYVPVPVPVPSPPEKVYVPGPPVPVPVEVIKRMPLPYPVDKSYPVPSPPKIIRVPTPVPEPIPVPGPVRDVPVPVPSPPVEVSVPYPVNRYVPAPGKDRVVVLPISHNRYHSVTKIIFVAEHCRYHEPLVPFRLSSDPCRIHVCKIQYNYVYDEAKPDGTCHSYYPGNGVVPYGLNTGGGSTYAQADASSSATGPMASIETEASSNVGLRYFGLGGEDEAHADTPVIGWSGDASAHADAHTNAKGFGYGGWGQSSALSDAIAHAGLGGYDLKGWGNIEASAPMDILAQVPGSLGGWGKSQASGNADALTQGYGALGGWTNSQVSAQADALAQDLGGLGKWGNSQALAQADSLAQGLGGLGGWGNSQADALPQGLGGLSGWGSNQADAITNVGLEGFGELGGWGDSQVQADTSVSSGGWGSNIKAEALTNAASGGYGQVEALSHALASTLVDRSDHNVDKRSVSLSGIDESERSGLAPLILPNPNPTVNSGLWKRLPVWKNSDIYAHALAQAQPYPGLEGWESPIHPMYINGRGLRQPNLIRKSELSASADAQAQLGLDGYSSANAEALANAGLRWGNLGPVLPGKYDSGFRHLLIPISSSKASANAEAVGRADELEVDGKYSDEDSGKCNGCGSGDDCPGCLRG